MIQYHSYIHHPHKPFSKAWSVETVCLPVGSCFGKTGGDKEGFVAEKR
jgi:hypothetical protein